MPVDSLDGENGAGILYAMEMPDRGWITFNRKNHIKQLTLHQPG